LIEKDGDQPVLLAILFKEIKNTPTDQPSSWSVFMEGVQCSAEIIGEQPLSAPLLRRSLGENAFM